MKKVQRSSFKLNPIAAAIVVAMSAQLPANTALAGAGWGLTTRVANPAQSVPVQAFYANSPSGSVQQIDASGAPVFQTVTDPVTGATSSIPVMVDSGKALRKFVDTLPGLGESKVNNLGQYIPVATPEKWVDTNGNTTGDDYYEIAAVEFSEKMHSDLPKATHLRGYVQLSTATNPGKHIQLFYPAVGAAAALPILDTSGNPVYAYDNPHHLGPFINATSGTAVRVKFSNYLPVGGQLFLPVDTTITGAGLGPDNKTYYTQNRAEIHLVGGQAPWVSAGSPHQWVAPAGETAAIAAGLGKGASNKDVPDMNPSGNGSTTLYFPNAQSARFMFYQDRTSGLTRLNNYAGLEAGYMVTDATENALIYGGTVNGVSIAAAIPADQIPLIIEDKTFVPANVAQQDANWDATNWGQSGDLWFPHVYETNQDPTAVNGLNSVGRWDYGPWFWPIFTATAPLPAVSFVPEAYEDTPLVNGTAYPTVTIDPKAYRFRILNASNDRFLNLGLYKADATVNAPQLDRNGNQMFDASGNPLYFTNTEVKMVPAVADVTGAPLTPTSGTLPTGATTGSYPFYDPTCLCQYPAFQQLLNYAFSGPTRAWPVDGRIGGAPDPTAVGPDFIAIGTDGGFLPNPVDIPTQPVTYESNRRSVTVTNVYGYGLLVGPSERTDAVVDFTAYAGQTLILYNDAPTPFPFDDARWDYFTGDVDNTATGGTYQTKPGYGPNTRTIMQIKVNGTIQGTTPTVPFNAATLLTALPAAYKASQPAPIVPQSAYNAAFGTNDTDNYAHVATGALAQPTFDFTQNGTNMSVASINLISSGGQVVTGTTNIVGNTIPGSGSGYDPLNPPTVNFVNGNCLPSTGATAVATAIVDSASQQVTGIVITAAGAGYTCAPQITFTSTVGVGAQASPIMSSGTSSILAQTKTEQELFDAMGRYNSTGGVELPLTTDLTQTTVPLNYTDSPTDFIKEGEVQIWKIVDNGFWSNSMHFDMVDVQLINRVGWDGTVKAPANNEVGWKDTIRLNPLEDMVVAMRAKTPPVPFGQPASIRAQDPSLAIGAAARSTQLAFTADPGVLAPVPSATSATGYDLVATGAGSGAALLTTAVNTDIVVNNATGVLPVNNTLAAGNLGYDNEFIWGTALLGHSEDDYQRPVVFHPTVTVPAAPINLADATGTGVLTWTDTTPAATSLGNTSNEIGFKVQTVSNGIAITQANLPANVTSFTEPTPLVAGITYQVVAWNNAGTSVASNTFTEGLPVAPTGLALVAAFITPATSTADVAVTLTWADNANNEQNYIVSRNGVAIKTLPANTTSYADTGVTENTLYNYSVAAQNAFGASAASTASLTTPISVPLAPASLAAVLTPATGKPANVTLSWVDKAFNATSLTVTRTGGAGAAVVTPLAITATGYVDTTALEGNTYTYAVTATNAAGSASATTSILSPVTVPLTPTAFTATASTAVEPSTATDAGLYVEQVTLNWTNNAFNDTSYNVLRNGAVIATLAADTAYNTPMSYVDTGVVDASAYTYQVVAINTAGQSSATASATTPGIAIAAPSGLVATVNKAGTAISLSWIDNATNETSYRVDESTDGGVTWAVLPPLITRNATLSAATGGTVTQTRTPAVPGTVYNYRVAAQNVAQKSDSAYVTTTVSLGAPVAPAAPTGLTSTVNATSGAVTLTWVAVTPATGTTIAYLVSINGAAPTVVNGTTFRPTAAQMPVGSSYTVTVATQATQYGLNTASATAASTTVNLSAPTALSAPTGLAATVNATSGAVALSWTAVTGASGYVVTINGGTPIAVTGTKFNPTAVQMPVNAVYSVTVASNVTSFGLTTASIASAPISVVLTVSAPAAPVQNAPTVTATRAALSWAAVTGATSYVVQSSTNGGAWTTVTTINNGTTVAYNATLVAGNSYQFQVIAQTTKFGLPTVPSAASNSVTANTLPAQSTGLAATAGAAGSKSIAVNWVNTSGNLTGWTVQRGVTVGRTTTWTTIAPTITATGTAFAFTDTGLTTGTTYSYTVAAKSAMGSTAVVTSAGVKAP
jgi:hypothetical protein